MNVTYQDYIQRFGMSRVTQSEFPPLAYDASRLIAVNTTGIDGYRKLEMAYPTDPYDAEAVMMCACKLIDILWQINQANETARLTRGSQANGHAGKITSMSAGNESISYDSSVSGGGTALDKAISDSTEKNVLVHEIVTMYL